MTAIESSRQGFLYLGKYEALHPLGEGGMGKVYLGRQSLSGQQVVIKVLHPHLAKDAKIRQCFLREIQTLMRFRHPHAVRLLDGSSSNMASVGTSGEGDDLCLVMEFVPGTTVADLLGKEGRLSSNRVGKMLGQICSVLHAAHQVGILHRDITAGNVMVLLPGTSRESIKVMDFGLARPGGSGVYIPLEKLTNSGQGVGPGTPDYICPEQIRGEPVDHRGDIFSTGVLLFKLLTARMPFENLDAVEDILQAQVKRPAPRFKEVGVLNVPREVEAVVQDCLRKKPEERPQSARELAERFEKALGEKILASDAFPDRAPELPSPVAQVDPANVLDRLEAWMPEQIAVMKLRGFIEGGGGEVLESIPGLIHVRFVDPRSAAEKPAPQGLLSFLGLGRRVLKPKYLHLNLNMENKNQANRSQVEITVSLVPDPEDDLPGAQMRLGFARRLCRELRAYLMIG